MQGSDYSIHSYLQELLRAFIEDDDKTFEFEGKKYTKYEAQQMQNRLESVIIKHKDLAVMAKSRGDDDLRRETQAQINLLTSKYYKLSQESGLPTRAERMQVSGFRSVKTESTPSGQAKYKAIVKRKNDEAQYQKYIDILGAGNMPKTIDEFQKMKYTDIDKWDDLKYYARHINEKPIEYIKIDRELYKKGIKKGRAFPVEDIDISWWNKHAEDRLNEANLSKESALAFKKMLLQ